MSVKPWDTRLPAYEIISEFYGDRQTERSKIKLMAHINEGLEILHILRVNYETKSAYCLHPLFQDDALLYQSYPKITNGAWWDRLVTRNSLVLVMEYRNVANLYRKEHYLPGTVPTLSPLREVNQMLIADKLQTFKDFMRYRYATHPDAHDIHDYFRSWAQALDMLPAFCAIDHDPETWHWSDLQNYLPTLDTRC